MSKLNNKAYRLREEARKNNYIYAEFYKHKLVYLITCVCIKHWNKLSKYKGLYERYSIHK